jgi:NodT family efflux transporter outer membrane factor (OMF) lipoprotein
MKRALLPLMLVPLLGACAQVQTGPQASSVAVPSNYRFAAEVAPDLPPFDIALADLLPRRDQALAALLEAALTAPSVEAALARIDAARAVARREKANSLPDVSGSSDISTSRLSTNSNAGSSVAPAPVNRNQNELQLGASATWEVDLFGRLRASRRAALLRLDAADADAQAVKLGLESDIALALIDYRDAAAREAVVNKDLADAAELVQLTQVRARAGIVAGFDVVRAQSLERDARSRLAPFAGTKASAVGQLVALTALDGLTVQALLDSLPQTTSPLALSAGVPSLSLKNRPDVRASALRLSAAQQDVSAAAAARFPRLSLTGTLGLLTLGSSSLFDGDALSASLGAGLAGPLLDFGRIGFEIAEQEAQAKEAFADYRSTLFQAIGDVEAGLGEYEAARARAARLSEQVTFDADAASIAQERYRLGISDLLTVIDARRTANISRQNAEGARLDVQRKAILLYQALGGEPNP